MALATAMYHTEYNPLEKLSHDSPKVPVTKGESKRRLHKAFLRYHDPDNWPTLRKALVEMKRRDLIGHGRDCLVPPERPGHKTIPKRRRGAPKSRRSG
jgi:radical SAM superfamily enzyme YgiQ (UPF0313 family)